MEHVEGWTKGPIPDGLHPWKRLQIFPGHAIPVHVKQLGSLHGPGVPEV